MPVICLAQFVVCASAGILHSYTVYSELPLPAGVEVDESSSEKHRRDAVSDLTGLWRIVSSGHR